MMDQLGVAFRVLDRLPTPVFYVGGDGVLQLCNPSAAHLFGSDPESLLGRPIDVLAHDHPNLLALVHQVFAEREKTTRMLRFETGGKTIGVLLSVIPDIQDGELRGVILTGVDATFATEALREARVEVAEHKRDLVEAQAALAIIEEPMLALPRDLRGIEFAAAYRSASHVSRVGGDFYDVLELAPYSYAVLLGDVSGKGTAAAPATTIMKQGVRAYASEGHPPSRIFQMLNRSLLGSLPPEMFVTATLAFLDSRNGHLTWANAGHPPGVVSSRDQGLALLEPTGPVLGVIEEPSIEDERIELPVEGYLFMYTDGVTEARRGSELFGQERLLEVLGELPPSSPQQVVDAVYAAISSFTHSDFDDDIAMLTLARSAAVE